MREDYCLTFCNLCKIGIKGRLHSVLVTYCSNHLLMMESVVDDGLRSELEMLESMFPGEFSLVRGGQFPECSIKGELVNITLHISFPGTD